MVGALDLDLEDVGTMDCDGDPTGMEVRLGGPRLIAPPIRVQAVMSDVLML